MVEGVGRLSPMRPHFYFWGVIQLERQKSETDDCLKDDPHFIYSLEVRIIDLENKIIELEKKLTLLTRPASSNSTSFGLPEKVEEQLRRGENRVRVLRLFRGLTQQQLSEASGIRANHISAIENGMRFGLKTARKIAGALDVPVGWLT